MAMAALACDWSHERGIFFAPFCSTNVRFLRAVRQIVKIEKLGCGSAALGVLVFGRSGFAAGWGERAGWLRTKRRLSLRWSCSDTLGTSGRRGWNPLAPTHERVSRCQNSVTVCSGTCSSPGWSKGPAASMCGQFANWPPSTWSRPISSPSGTSRTTSFTSVMTWAWPRGPCADVRRAQVLLPQHARLPLAPVHPKKVRKPRRERLPDVRSDEDCRRLIATLEKPIYRGCFALIYAYGLRITEAVTLPVSTVTEADGPPRHRQAKQGACPPADRIDPPDAPRGLDVSSGQPVSRCGRAT